MRRFKNLNSLNLDGNPFCQNPGYKPFAISHLPALVYLDYRLVDEQMREAANEYNNNRYSVEAMMQDEAAALKKQEEIAKKEADFQHHKVVISYFLQSRPSIVLGKHKGSVILNAKFLLQNCEMRLKNIILIYLLSSFSQR